MLLYLAFKNIISKKSSFVIILFIAFAIMMLVITNSVFDSTEKGVQETFINSFTGDIVIRPKNENPLSLFGDESPITGNHTEIPTLVPFNDIKSVLEEDEHITKIIPQLTGLCMTGDMTAQQICFAFGVNAKDYCNTMSSIKIIEGRPWENGEKGAMLSSRYVKKFGLHLGDDVNFIYTAGLNARLRAVPLTAIYEYTADNPILDKIVLVNPETIRALFDITDYTSSTEIKLSDEKEDFLSGMDIDDMFAETSDVQQAIITEEEFIDESEMQKIEDSYITSSTWNFIVCRLNDSKDTISVMRNLNDSFAKNGWEVEAVNWRSSAGNTAFYLYLLRVVLNIGIIIILIAGFIVINNTLVINVLDRIREIGTMRAIGANKRYISAECMAETLMMTTIAGILGCILGVLASSAITLMHIHFTNSFLIQLFGNGSLVTSITFRNISCSFILSLILGMIAWIYPVINALKANPVQAMQGAK